MKLYCESNSVIRRELQVNGMYNWAGVTSRLQAQPLVTIELPQAHLGDNPTHVVSVAGSPAPSSVLSQRTKAKP